MNGAIEVNLNTEPITGKERCTLCGEAYNALVQIYRVFNSRDLPLMKANWHNGDDIAMDNPVGGIKRGWREIGAVYDRLFNGAAKVHVEFYDYTVHETGHMFYAVGRERGRFERDGKALDLAIRTSRIFRRIDGTWRQVHHGSIDDPESLARYQRAMLGQ